MNTPINICRIGSSNQLIIEPSLEKLLDTFGKISDEFVDTLDALPQLDKFVRLIEWLKMIFLNDKNEYFEEFIHIDFYPLFPLV